MTNVRTKAAIASVAILLASCTGVDGPGQSPPQVSEDAQAPMLANSPMPITTVSAEQLASAPPPPPPPAPREAEDRDENAVIVVTGTQVSRQANNSYSPAVSVSSGYVGGMRSPDPRAVPTPLYLQGRDRFSSVDQNPFRIVSSDPVSTFSIDVDTASYGWMRASLNRNVLPQPDSVRTEELVNYFPYDYARPDSAARPFTTSVDVFPSPWVEGRKVVRIGIRGYDIAPTTRPRANLVFLIDTSGSMSAPNKLELVKQSMAMLLDQLDPNDQVAIVTYAGNAGTALEPTAAREKNRILSVIQNLGAGGSTAGAEGIRQAYALAEQNLDRKGVNRVILATDGDFNVGITDPDELQGFVERQRGKGIFLSVLGFGMGNYNDELMQQLAQNGNGTAAYIDTLSEARKTLVEESTSTLFPIAKDVKIQIEFNPATVAEYRLVGYETRMLQREDFDNDRVDAGDVGSGQTVTAIYEIVPVGGPLANGDLRYSRPVVQALENHGIEYGFVKIRYKQPNSDRSQLLTTSIDMMSEVHSFAEAPRDARWATGVASFAELLRGGRYTGSMTYDDVLTMVSAARGDDEFGYRSEFIQLVRAARTASAMARLER